MARASSAPSGTRSDSVRCVRPDVDGDVEERATLLLALRQLDRRHECRVATSTSTRRTAVGLVRRRTRRRPPPAPATPRPARPTRSASRLQAIGLGAGVGHAWCRAMSDVSGELHLPEVLEQLLQDVEQHRALRLACRGRGRRGRGGRWPARPRVEPGDVLGQAPPGLLGPAEQPSHAPLAVNSAARSRCIERSATVAPPQYSMTPRQWVRITYGELAPGKVGRRLASSSPRSLDDACHAAEREVDEPEVVRRR